MTYTEVYSLRKQAAEPVAFTKYKIKPGDTFSGIGKTNQVSIKRLQAANPSLRSNALRVGATMNIPVPDWQDIMTRKGFDPRRAQLLSPETRRRIGFVESSNGINTFNPKTEATGWYQVTPVAFKEAQRLNPAFSKWTLKDMMDEARAAQVMDTLMNKWAVDFQFKHERPITEDVLVRMWHAGPVNYNGSQARAYASKVYSKETGKHIL